MDTIVHLFVQGLIIGVVLFIAVSAISELRYFSQLPKIKKDSLSLYDSAFFATENNTVNTLQTIITHVQASGYRIDVFDREQGLLLLSKSFLFDNYMTDGFSYHIQVNQQESTHTRVTVAITPKIMGSLSGTKVRQTFFLSEIEAAVFAGTRREQEAIVV